MYNRQCFPETLGELCSRAVVGTHIQWGAGEGFSLKNCISAATVHLQGDKHIIVHLHVSDPRDPVFSVSHSHFSSTQSLTG